MNHCSSCGTPLNGDVKFCPSCGTPNTGETQRAKQETTTREVYKESKRLAKKLPLKTTIIAAVLLLLIGATATAAVFLKKSPKDLYLLAEYNTMQQAKEEWNTNYGDMMEFYKKMMQQPSETDLELKADVEIESLEGDPDYEMMRELLKTVSLSMHAVEDPVKNNYHTSLALNVEKEKALDVELLTTKEQIGIKVPVLYDKFLYLNSADYGEFMRMFDPYYEGPETLEGFDIRLEDLILKEEEMKHLQDTFTSLLLEELKEENFTLEKGVDYAYEGEEMKLRKVTLSLSEQETKSLINKFLDQLIADKEIHNMIASRVELMMKAVAFEEDLADELPSQGEIKKELIAALKDAKSGLKEIGFPGGFTSVILIDNDEIILDRTMKLAISNDYDEQINTVLTSKNISYGDKQQIVDWKLELSPEEDDDSKIALQFTNDIEKGKEKRTEDLNAVFSFVDYGDESNMTFNMVSVIESDKGSKKNIDREFELTFSEDGYYAEEMALKGQIEQVSDLNVKKGTSADQLKVTVDWDDSYDSFSLMLDLDSKTVLKDKAEMPKLDKGAVNIVKVSEDEMYTIYEEVLTNLYALGEEFGLIPEDELFTSTDADLLDLEDFDEEELLQYYMDGSL